jgi:hypothetical protein
LRVLPVVKKVAAAVVARPRRRKPVGVDAEGVARLVVAAAHRGRVARKAVDVTPLA